MLRITNVEEGETSKGQPMKHVTLSNGATIGVFQFNSLFTDVEEGMKLEESDFHQKGEWINLTDPEKGRPKGATDPDFSSIGKSKDAGQDRMEYSIRLTKTIDMAHQTVMTLIEAGAYDKLSDDKIKSEIGIWRNWYNKEWENIKGDEPVTPQDLPF